MAILPETLDNLKKGLVQELNLAPYTIELQDMKAIIEYLPENKRMKAILFGNCSFDRHITEQFTKAIKDHPSLIEIAIGSNSEVGDIGARAFADMLTQNEVFASLCLNHCNIADVGARAFARVLKQNRSLNILDLSHNKISDGGAGALAESLENNRALTRLRLDANKIGYHGINALAEAFDGNQTLVEFTLLDNHADDRTLEPLEKAFENSHNIINLKLNKNRNVPVCDENKRVAMRLFDALDQHGVGGLSKEDIAAVKKRLHSLMYVAEYDLRIPRYRILEVMASFRHFIHKDMVSA